MKELLLATNVTVSFVLMIPLSAMIALLIAKKIRFGDLIKGVGYSLLIRVVFNLISNAVYQYHLFNETVNTILFVLLSTGLMLFALSRYDKIMNNHSSLSFGLGFGFIEEAVIIGFPVVYTRIFLSFAAKGNIYEYFPDMSQAEVDALVNQYTSIPARDYFISALLGILIILFYLQIFTLYKQAKNNGNQKELVLAIAAICLIQIIYQTFSVTGYLVGTILLAAIDVALFIYGYKKDYLRKGIE